MKTILITLASTIIISSLHFSTNVVADDKPKSDKDQVGRFTLHIVNKGEEHIIYRIDSVTGNVSVFNPNEKTLIKNEDIDKVVEKPELAKEMRAKGYLVFEKPYWKKIPEKLENILIDLSSKN